MSHVAAKDKIKKPIFTPTIVGKIDPAVLRQSDPSIAKRFGSTAGVEIECGIDLAKDGTKDETVTAIVITPSTLQPEEQLLINPPSTPHIQSLRITHQPTSKPEDVIKNERSKIDEIASYLNTLFIQSFSGEVTIKLFRGSISREVITSYTRKRRLFARGSEHVNVDGDGNIVVAKETNQLGNGSMPTADVSSVEQTISTEDTNK